MEMVIGWTLLVALVVIVVVLMKVAGPPGESKPHCGLRDDGGRSGGTGCH